MIAARVGAMISSPRAHNDRQMLASAIPTGTVNVWTPRARSQARAPGRTSPSRAQRRVRGRGPVLRRPRMVRRAGEAGWVTVLAYITMDGHHPLILSGDSYGSRFRLRSVELNVKWFPTDHLSVLAGPRYSRDRRRAGHRAVNVGGIGRISHDTTTTETR